MNVLTIHAPEVPLLPSAGPEVVVEGWSLERLRVMKGLGGERQRVAWGGYREAGIVLLRAEKGEGEVVQAECQRDLIYLCLG